MVHLQKSSAKGSVLKLLVYFSKRIITVGSAVPSTSHVIISTPNLAHEMRVRVTCGHCNEIFIVSLFLYILFSLATGTGSPQQREPNTVGPYYLSHPVNFPCGRKSEYPEKTPTFDRALTRLFSREDWVQIHLTGDQTWNLRD